MAVTQTELRASLRRKLGDDTPLNFVAYDEVLRAAHEEIFPFIYRTVIDESLTTIANAREYILPTNTRRYLFKIELADSGGFYHQTGKFRLVGDDKLLFTFAPGPNRRIRLWAAIPYIYGASPDIPNQYAELVVLGAAAIFCSEDRVAARSHPTRYGDALRDIGVSVGEIISAGIALRQIFEKRRRELTMPRPTFFLPYPRESKSVRTYEYGQEIRGT